MKAHASPKFAPTCVFTDYITAAVLAGSKSLVHKRLKPYQVAELGDCDDTGKTQHLTMTGSLTHGLSLALSCSFPLVLLTGSKAL